MRLGIHGYGRMGALIHQAALQAGHEVTAIIDPVSGHQAVTAQRISEETAAACDVLIDFSVPSAAVDTIKACSSYHLDLVVGTTGWYDRLDEAEELVRDGGIGCIWSGNFSLGVHILFSLVKQAAVLMNGFPDYDCMVHEYHHSRKADSPSGTAAMIAQMITERMDRKDTVITEALSRQILPNELHVSSTRGGSIPGTHTVTFDSEVDTLSLTHTARSREGFASGAVRAAEWVTGRDGLFAIDDMMNTLVKGEQ